MTTPSALGGDRLAQSTGAIGHVLTGEVLSNLANESITPTISVAGEHVVAPFALRMKRRLQAATSSIHVWVHCQDLYIEDSITRNFRMGVWALLREALVGYEWLFTGKIAGDISSLLNDLASVSSLAEEGELALDQIQQHRGIPVYRDNRQGEIGNDQNPPYHPAGRKEMSLTERGINPSSPTVAA